MKQEEICSRLIDSAIHVVANEGLHKATTKAISVHSGINETNIYRFFNDKEDLLAKAFTSLDCELVSKVMLHIQIMHMQKIDFKARCEFLFNSIWKFLLQNREKCVTFVRYYYSTYFEKYSLIDHRQRFQPLINEFDTALKPESNTWMILNHILSVMLDFAIKVFNKEVSDNEDTAKHVFMLVYSSIELYRRNPEAPDSEETSDDE